jgi:hypothetical protein
VRDVGEMLKEIADLEDRQTRVVTGSWWFVQYQERIDALRDELQQTEFVTFRAENV